MVGVDALGRISLEGLASALAAPAGVLAVQSANLEVGTVQPLPQVAAAAASAEVPLFVDFAASAGRLDLPAGWAAAAASAHKWGGPAGVGLLLVRKGARWRAPFPTDDRVDPRVAGFENVPGVLAAAAALQAVVAERAEVGARQRALVDRIRSRVAASVPDVDVVGDPDDRLPHVVTFSCLYVEGEALVRELDRRGFGVSSGSACSASTLTPSHVLAAMGALTHGNIRVSLGRDTTEADVDAFLAVLPEVVAAPPPLTSGPVPHRTVRRACARSPRARGRRRRRQCRRRTTNRGVPSSAASSPTYSWPRIRHHAATSGRAAGSSATTARLWPTARSPMLFASRITGSGQRIPRQSSSTSMSTPPLCQSPGRLRPPQQFNCSRGTPERPDPTSQQFNCGRTTGLVAGRPCPPTSRAQPRPGKCGLQASERRGGRSRHPRAFKARCTRVTVRPGSR